MTFIRDLESIPPSHLREIKTKSSVLALEECISLPRLYGGKKNESKKIKTCRGTDPSPRVPSVVKLPLLEHENKPSRPEVTPEGMFILLTS